MATPDNQAGAAPADPFTKFWQDMMSKTASAGMTAPMGPMTEDTMKHMRQAFLDAWAKYCEEFMGSEPFLDGMKKSMDGALAFRQQVNEFLTKTLRDRQMPSVEDTDSILEALHTFESRVVERLEQLSGRMDELERRAGAAPASAPKARKTKGATK